MFQKNYHGTQYFTTQFSKSREIEPPKTCQTLITKLMQLEECLHKLEIQTQVLQMHQGRLEQQLQNKKNMLITGNNQRPSHQKLIQRNIKHQRNRSQPNMENQKEFEYLTSESTKNSSDESNMKERLEIEPTQSINKLKRSKQWNLEVLQSRNEKSILFQKKEKNAFPIKPTFCVKNVPYSNNYYGYCQQNIKENEFETIEEIWSKPTKNYVKTAQKIRKSYLQ